MGWGINLVILAQLKRVLCECLSVPTAYGVSTSWFFDQHFYVGLADDMDLGIRWNDTFDKLTLDVGYYPLTDPQLIKYGSLASSRYSYDVVKWEEKADAKGNVEWGAGENGF